MMKARTKFLKMYYKLPIRARRRFVYYTELSLMSIAVIMTEVTADTRLGKKILKDLGYEDDD